ncbi:MAG: SPOR domain-containing protein [Gallionella sp.]|nr:SPOR domain-containing protein [Gallionella sp.]
MAKQPDEQIIKSRARRRLIGAIALALAVVVILPMVLDSEPRITGQDIDLRIPASDKVGEFVPGVALSEVLEAASQAESAVNPPVASEVPAVKFPVPQAAASGKITVAEIKPEGLNTAAISKPAEAVQAAIKKPEVNKPEARQAEDKKPEAKPVEVKKPEAKPAEAKKPEAKPVEVKPVEKGSYIVQIGAFANADTAAQEADKLKAWGFKGYTELIAGTTRVRVGPYVDRNKADEVRQLLEKHGLHPVITAVK